MSENAMDKLFPSDSKTIVNLKYIQNLTHCHLCLNLGYFIFLWHLLCPWTKNFFFEKALLQKGSRLLSTSISRRKKVFIMFRNWKRSAVLSHHFQSLPHEYKNENVIENSKVLAHCHAKLITYNHRS